MTAKRLSQNLLPGVPLIESPLFAAELDTLNLSPGERAIATRLHEDGFAVFEFPDTQLSDRIDRILRDLSQQFDFDHWRRHEWRCQDGLRAQDAWRTHPDVRAIATNQCVIDLLSRLYGRRAFPFQTLNFPVGSQQHVHSDSVHFSSAPERFICGVWLAMEDIDANAGPLVYYPGSHKWPILTNEMLGRRVGWTSSTNVQAAFEPAWRALIDASGLKPTIFTPKKGQALIWAANLLHGGASQTDAALTRWSQVTHYYFEGCTYYTPAFSDISLGNLALRRVRDISTGEIAPNIYIDRRISDVVGHYARAIRRRLPGLDPA